MSPTWLPLEDLFDTYGRFEFARQLLQSGAPHELVNRIESVTEAFRDYAVPVISLVSESLEHVVSCFRRLNAGGVPLSELHLLNALMMPSRHGEPDLDARTEELVESLAPAGFASLGPQLLLDVCKLRAGPAWRHGNLGALAEMLAHSDDLLIEARDAILAAARVLDRIAGVRGAQSLPYWGQLVVLASALDQGTSLDLAALDRLRRWFWATTLGAYFTGTARLSARSVAHLRGVIDGDAGPVPPKMPTIVEPTDPFNYRSPRSRGLALLMAEQGPVGFGDGSHDPFDMLAKHGGEALLRLVRERELAPKDAGLARGIGNRFLLHPLDREHLSRLSEGSPDVLTRNFVDAEARAALESGDRATFLARRRDALERLEASRAAECGLTYRPSG